MRRLYLGGARVDLWALWDRYSLYCFGTKKEFRNQGHAKRLLRAIRKLADRKGLPVYLTAAPFPYDGPMPELHGVVSLYSRMGWEIVKDRGHSVEMIYTPKRKRDGREVHRLQQSVS